MNFQKDPLHNKIFETLRDRIVYRDYHPGMSLSEKELCEEFKVSRTPLREAIKKLEDMKLVTAIPRYGTYVAPIDINEIRCAFEVKIKLEGLAGQLAARRITVNKLKEINALINQADFKENHRTLIEIDADFHEIIRQVIQNPILQEILENLHSRCARLWNSALGEIIPIEQVVDQLKEIYLALEKRDADKAGRLMESHVQYFIDKIKNQLL
ncbi:MAG: GntR family transcriptional regulator [Deltaproteobacteria bacterium]|nr:GntR family transcriptional regulator [Deltaproteobacteria bacterium]MBW2306596.1 GntR family transcriptional regulator [Deltaproteobacteria bacterium]